MVIDLSDKIVVITGGSKGIGEGLVKAFAKQGCYVYFTYLKDYEHAEALQGVLNDKGYHVAAVQVDSGELLKVRQFVEEVDEKHGRIDIVINNAGYIPRGLFFSTTKEVWDRAIQTNLNGVYNFCQAVLKHMVLKKQGVILNITSVSALQPNIGQSAYGASKAAVESLTKTLAIEYGKHNIRVNTIAPGLIETQVVKSISKKVKAELLKKTPLDRFGKIEDVVDTALFLASDKASYITGSQILVTGGRHLI